jgi:FAD:protein FMN transferase
VFTGILAPFAAGRRVAARPPHRRPALVRAAVVVLSLLLSSTPAAHAATDSLFHDVRRAMGSTFEIYLYAPDGVRAAELFEAAAAEIERVEAVLSHYRPASELSRLNTRAGHGPVRTDPEVFALLELSLELSRRTAGAFDITVGRLMQGWGFFRGSGHYPSREALDEARAQTGWAKVKLDRAERTVHFLVPGLQLDPGAIGKGYAVDRVADLFRAVGVRAALIGFGASSFYALGAPPGRPGWPIRIPNPVVPATALSTAVLRDQALSTSGSFEKFFELEGRRYSHLMDPRTGHPVAGMIQATVITPSATYADALSTALFVVGPEGATRLLAELPSSSALLVAGEQGDARNVPFNWPSPVSATSFIKHGEK